MDKLPGIVPSPYIYLDQRHICEMGPKCDTARLCVGDAWASECTHRVLLSVDDGQRHATVAKSSCLPPAQAQYTITDRGIENAPGAAER
jgi:hypothetical protein